MKKGLTFALFVVCLMGCRRAKNTGNPILTTIITRLASLNPYHGYQKIDTSIDPLSGVVLHMTQQGDSSILLGTSTLPLKLISFDTAAKVAVFSAITAPFMLTYNWQLDTVFYNVNTGGVHSEYEHLYYP